MNIVNLKSGSNFTLYAVVEHGRCAVQEFIDSLVQDHQRQIINLFNYILENGPPRNVEKFKSLGDNVYELKTRSGVRILCFFGIQKSLVLTHGFYKVKQRQLQREKEKAKEFHKKYYDIT
jgi:phage-related protein